MVRTGDFRRTPKGTSSFGPERPNNLVELTSRDEKERGE
jgi:hypothetical protein